MIIGGNIKVALQNFKKNQTKQLPAIYKNAGFRFF